MIVILMGVSGVGKTTVGELLAAQMRWRFYDGDAFHPASNVDKMSRGLPLTDEDRWPWLEALRDHIRSLSAEGRSAVVACSALKASYREVLLDGSPDARVVHLKGSYPLIEGRLRSRRDHYFEADLLASQFETLEDPDDVIAVDVGQAPDRVVAEIRTRLGLQHDAESRDGGEAEDAE